MKKIIIINGPNLNLLGKREPETYGDKSFDSYFKELELEFPFLELTSFQSNVEGEIIKYSPGDFILFDSTQVHTSQPIKKIPYWRTSINYVIKK